MKMREHGRDGEHEFKCESAYEHDCEYEFNCESANIAVNVGLSMITSFWLEI